MRRKIPTTLSGIAETVIMTAVSIIASHVTEIDNAISRWAKGTPLAEGEIYRPIFTL